MLQLASKYDFKNETMTNINEYSDYEIKALANFTNSLTAKRWSKSGLVSLLKLLEAELELVSVKTYSEKKGITTQAARRKEVIKIDTLQLKSLKSFYY